MASPTVKLLPHRWDMHAVQALARGDHALLYRVFTTLELPRACVDTKVHTFGCGAPSQFHSYGFFDRHSAPSSDASALLERVVEGDTLLLLALRNGDARSAAALVQVGASLHEANAAGETPLQCIFDFYAALQLHDRQQTQREATGDSTNLTDPTMQRVVYQRAAFTALFALVEPQLVGFHDATRARVREQLETLYSACAPERLAKLSAQLDDFAFRELELLAAVQRKYELA